VDLAQSVFVGDSETDAMAGRAAGCRTIAVASGLASLAEIAAWKTRPDAVFPSLADAVDAILDGSGALDDSERP
jgi:phosphoglycolate phosphatase-like HAD superfamily hydrolase